MGATEIAKAVGCKRGNVYKALKAAGLNYAGRSLHLMLGWVV
jgi:predicted transcriptional regulator with HTH domain